MSQSATKVHSMHANYAHLDVTLRAAPDAHIKYVPRPTIVNEDARCLQTVSVDLEDTAIVVVADVLVPDGGIVPAYARTVDRGETPGHYAVVLGSVAHTARIARREVCLLNAYSFVTGLLGAAQRLGRFGHAAIQAQLTRLLPGIEQICDPAGFKYTTRKI